MSGILCPIRGGPGSTNAIELGIRLAKETGERLHFLYVVNLDFLNMTQQSRTHVLSAEMRGMGEFILLAAQAKAEDAGVLASGIVRQGEVMDEIVAYAREVEASHVILGRPKAKGEEQVNIFTTDLLKDFTQQLEEVTGSKVVLTDDGGEL
jgi:nucleotide-binding universal stress UspA family protein